MSQQSEQSEVGNCRSQGVTKRHGVVFLALWAAAPNLLAQEPGIELGAATLYPTIGLSIGYDDNITFSPDHEISSWYFLISPALRLQTGNRRNSFVFEYGLEDLDYKDSDFDDYTDHSLSASWQYIPTFRDELNLRGAYNFGHDRRGEGLRDFYPVDLRREVDQFEMLSVDVNYRHGADGARGRIELNGGLTEKQYQNNQQLTVFGDYDQWRYGGAFLWRVASKSSLFLEAGVSETDYKISTLDNKLSFVGVGVQWEATALTEGRASYRYQEMVFDDDGQDSYIGAAWEISVRWTPKTYSVVEFSAHKETDVAFGASNLLVRDGFDLSWRHEWRAKIASFLDVGWLEADYNPGARIDQLFFYGLGASYSARHWLDVGLSYRHYNRDSSLGVFDYQRNEFLLSFELSL